jgi:glycosyltransferase involved in cell wall biosynthesis
LHRAPGVGLSGLPSARAHLAALERELKPDALIVHQPRASALARGLWPKAPRLYFFHSCWAQEFRADRGGRLGAAAREALERAELGSAAAAVALSRYMESDLLAHGLERGKLRRVPPGVDLERFQPGPAPRGRRLLTVRNLRRRMGLESLLEAFAALKAEDGELGLDIIGTGPLGGELEERAAALGLTDLRFLGRVPDAELPERYRAATLFVLPSRELEGLGLVLLEALACGLPAVGTPVGGIPEVLGPLEPAWLSAGTSPAELAEAVRRGLADAAEPGTKARCRAYAEGFPWSLTGAALEEILHELL